MKVFFHKKCGHFVCAFWRGFWSSEVVSAFLGESAPLLRCMLLVWHMRLVLQSLFVFLMSLVLSLRACPQVAAVACKNVVGCGWGADDSCGRQRQRRWHQEVAVGSVGWQSKQAQQRQRQRGIGADGHTDGDLA